MLILRLGRPHLANHYLHGLSESTFLEILLEMHLLGFLPLMVLLYSNFWDGAWKICVFKLAQWLFCTLKFENPWSMVTGTRSFPVVFKTAWGKKTNKQKRLHGAYPFNQIFWESRMTCSLAILAVFSSGWNGSLEMTWLRSCTVAFTAHRLGKWRIRASNVITTFIGQLHNKDSLRLLMGLPSFWLQY